MKPIIQLIVVSLSTFILSSCLSPVKPNLQTTYVLSATPNYVVSKPKRSTVILVMRPETNAAYDTRRMAYTTVPYEIAYYAKNSWAETPADMLQPLILQTLQKTHYFHAVVTPPFLGRYDYSLNTHILMLKVDFTHRPALLRLELSAQLNRVPSNNVIATKTIKIAQPLTSCTPYSAVIAANRATERMLRELAAFCVGKAR